MKLRWAVPLVFLVVLALCLTGMAQNYAPATNYPTSAAPQGLARGDFNEDGKPDFAVTDFNAALIQIFPGNGDGTFGSPIATSIAPHPYSVAAADLDGDGHLDLVISLVNAQGFEVLLGNGNGQFHSPVIYTVSGLPTTSTVGQAALRDINGDGKIDVVLATDRGISVFLNNGSGGFTQSSVAIDPGNAIANVAVLDLNGDRIPDLVATESTFDVNGNPTGTVVYALGHGDGTFGAITNIADFSGPPTGLVVADIDHDGLPDVVVSFATSTVGTGGGTGAVGCTPRICLPQDGGGGGTTTVPGGIGFIRQTAALQFAATSSIGNDKNPGFLIAGDFDGDGRLDVAEASTALAQILVYRGNGDGTFGVALPFTIPSIAGEIATESFGGTLAQDLFASAISTNQVSVFVNQGANTLSLVSSLNPAGLSQPVTLTATVQPKFPSAGTISGSVIFADGQATLGTAAVNPSGAATLPATFTTAGDHRLTAVYGGNSSFVGGSSASLVERAATLPGVTLSSSINPSSVGQAVNFTVAVAGSPSGPTPSGTITLFANGAPVLSATVDASGGAILTFSSLPLGTNDLLAQYSGDSNYPGADSPHISQIVNKNNSTATLTSSANPSTFGQSINFTVSVAPLSGTGTPTGNVTLKDAGTAIAAAPLDATGAAVIAVSNLSVGTHSLTVNYAGDANFNASSSALSQVVNATSTSVVLTDSPNPSTLGQAVVLHALVKATTGTSTPSGSVVFSEGATVLGSANLDATGTATLSATSLAIGSHNLTASYAGTASFQGSTSAAVVQVVNKNNSTATLTSSANPSSFGQAVNFTVSVAAPFNGAGTPTGNVTLKDAGTAIATAALDATGTAVISVNNLAAGTHPFTVDYAGDANFNVSSSASLSQVVNATSTSVVLTSSPNPSAFGQAVVLHAVVKAAVGTAAPSGSVTFNDGTTVLGSGSLDAAGTASLTVTSLTVGSHNLNASYAGNASFQHSTSASVAQVVNATSTSVAFISSPNPSTSGQAVALHAVVKAASGTAVPQGSVSFSEGTSVLGSATLDATGAASLSVTSLSVASHNLTATYAGNASFQSSTSAAVVQVVNAASTSVVLTSSPNPSTTGQAVVLHAVIKAASGTAIPSGSVAFNDGPTVLGSANLDATGAASLTVISFAIGSHTLTASYAGNTNFQGSTSAAVVQVVSTSSTSVSFSTSPNPSTLGQAVALTAVVKAATGGAPAGVVVFSDGTSVLGSANLDATGTAVLTLSSFGVGPHSLTASYAGNPSFQGSTSLVVTQVVNRSAVQIAMNSSANPSVYGQSVTLQIAVTSAVAGSTRVPTGNISFTDGAAVMGQVPLDATGHAVLTTNNLSASTHTISATYTGDTNFLSASASLAQIINKGVTTTSLSSSLNPATNVSTFTLHAVVTSAAGTPSGTVQFFDGAALIGSGGLDNTGSASLSISNSAVGNHSLSASFTGSSNLTSSASPAVNEAVVDSHSQVSLVSSANPQTSSQPVVFTAVVTPALNGQPVTGTITFRDGSQILASVPVSSGGANVSITQLAVGTHSIVASYQASTAPGPFDGISSPVTEVIQSSLAPDYSVSIQPAKGTVSDGATFTTAVSVAPVNGFTGSVTLGCAGLPANASCVFVPAQMAITGQAPATSRLQIVTARYMGASHVAPSLAKTNWGRMMAFWFAPGVFGCVLFQNRKRLRMSIVVVCVLASGLLIAGCGSSSSSRSNQTRQAQTYNVTVTASSGTVVHSTILQLTLQ